MKILFVFAILLLARQANTHDGSVEQFLTEGNEGGHTNNWAVLVCTSRFWFNYRHISNVLGMYRTVKRLGIPDSQIIMMLADDMACNPRNTWPAQVFDNENHRANLYGDNIEVDYRGYEVSVETLIRVMTGRHDKSTPRSKRLLSDANSNIFFYMTGHGGDQFIKFQDVEEISSHDLADAFQQMHEKKRYREILFMADTCQASTLHKQFYSPNIVAIGSSKIKENSYSHHTDYTLGVSVIDRFTFHTLDYFERLDMSSDKTVHDLFHKYNFEDVGSNVEWREDLFNRSLKSALLTDFFGSVTRTQLTPAGYPLSGVPSDIQESRDVEELIIEEDEMEENGNKEHLLDVWTIGYMTSSFVIVLVLHLIEKKIKM